MTLLWSDGDSSVHLASVPSFWIPEMSLLSENELAYCLQSPDEDLQRARAFLRVMTKRQLNDFQIEITRGELGRPLASTGHDIAYSHKHDWALAGVSKHKRIGIDIEFVDSIDQPEIFEKHCCSPEEDATLSAICEYKSIERKQALACLFSVKEAYAKAFGISFVPKDLTVLIKSYSRNNLLFNVRDRNKKVSKVSAQSFITGNFFISICTI